MALCARQGSCLLQSQRLLPCRCSATWSSTAGTPNSLSSGPAGLSSGGRASCGGAFMQQPQLGRRAFRSHRHRQAEVTCAAPPGGDSGDSASRVIAWAKDFFRLQGAKSQDDPQQLEALPPVQQAAPQQQHPGDTVNGVSVAQHGSLQQSSRRNSGSSAHDVADQHQQESFDTWKEYIVEIDEKIKAYMEVDELLQQAVAEERFEDAARLRRQVEELMRQDAVFVAMEELMLALEEERYGDAARIRDESHSGLVGWWAGRGEQDPYGHLLHVSAGFGCYTGRAYLPRQLTEIREYVNSGQLAEGDVDTVLLNMGQPMLEVFLRKDEDTGTLRSCATAIVPADTSQADNQRIITVEDGSDDSDEESNDSPLHVNVHISSNPGMDLGGSEGSSARDAAAVLENLKEEVLRQLKAGMQEHSDGQGSVDRDAFADIIDPRALAGAAGGDNAGIIELGDGSYEISDGDSATTVTVEVSNGPGGGGGPQGFSRHAADLRRFGKDRFVIQVLKDGDDWDPQDPGSDQEEGDDDADSNLYERVLLDLTEANGEPADISRRLTGDAPSAVQQTGGRRRPRLASDVRRQGRQGRLSLIQIADFDLSRGEDSPQTEALGVRDAVAREVRRLQEAHADGTGPAVDRQTIIALIRKVAKERRAARRKAEAVAAGAHPAGGLAAVNPAELFQGRISYRRIPTGLPHTDPFNGTYLAGFGPHGIEILLLTRKIDKGHEIVTARKLTGDPNVPAGEISFTAPIGRDKRLDVSEYPEIMGVTGRYAGKGLVAQPGFTEPRWVEGELLQFAEGSPVTQGARLGFMWASPNSRRFLVLLHRVGLDEEE